MYKFVIIVLFSLIAATLAGDPSDVTAETLKYTNEVNPDGSYTFEYGTSNGIEFAETGVGSSYASGSYSYTSPEGEFIQLKYTADENGYQPQGDHLPTPPPIPDYILRSLEYIESHPFPKISLSKRK